MKKYELIATTTFGLEAIVKRELIDLGFEIKNTENGKVTFFADLQGMMRANLWLRCADRVLIKVGEFKAETFDELFDRTKALNWADFIPQNGRFPVDGQSVKSTLFSISDSQGIVKKAIVENLKQKYKIGWFSEDGPLFQIKVSILKDIATITIDSSGIALHKRGYREQAVVAPIKETLAAALVSLSFWRKDRVLVDPFCGSGTIAIEAALIGKKIAPGLRRSFAFNAWPWVEQSLWEEERKKALAQIEQGTKLNIYGYDNLEENIQAARENAKAAGVENEIIFEVKEFEKQKFIDNYTVMISNPPYGERLSEIESVNELYRIMGEKLNKLKTWSIYLIIAEKEFETIFNRKADRRRKLYNGRIETTYYQYHGENPKKEVLS